MEEAGKISAKLEKKGMMVEFKDVLIGVSAKMNNYSLKTSNLKHFQRIEGLKLL